jgi:HTH-type transcriptional regulator/antitoxin MqsA
VSEPRIHPETGKELRRGVRPQTVVVGSLSRTVDVPGWYPDDESEGVHNGADLKAMDETYKTLREEYAAHVKAVRKRLGLTQEEAGVIIGGGKRAFQKYENGRTPPSDAAVGLIEVLARHPEEVAMLRTFRLVPEKPVSKASKRPVVLAEMGAKRSKRGVRKVHA